MCFPDEYIPHGVMMEFKGEELDLAAEDEEVASFYADVPLDGPHVSISCVNALNGSMNFLCD